MKTLPQIFVAATLLIFSSPKLHGQAAAGGVVTFTPGQAPAMLIYEDEPAVTVYIVNSNATTILYKTTPMASENSPQLKLTEVQSVYLFEPKPYTQAMELYQARKYAEAMTLFTKVSEDYKFTKALPNNFFLLGGFYQMECMRRLGDLEALSKAAAEYDSRSLTRPLLQRQFELYALWDAVRTKSWDRVIAVGEERYKERQPGYQRAQIAFCLGQAYEAQKKSSKALNAYNMALIADVGATHELAEQAAIAVMRFHWADEAVQMAMKNWGTEDEEKNSSGRISLVEAGAMAGLYQFFLGDGKPLPSQYNILLKYKPEVVKPEPAADEAAEPEKK